jgi:hypothetical protein
MNRVLILIAALALAACSSVPRDPSETAKVKRKADDPCRAGHAGMTVYCASSGDLDGAYLFQSRMLPRGSGFSD